MASGKHSIISLNGASDELEKEFVALLNSQNGGILKIESSGEGNIKDFEETIYQRLVSNILPSPIALFDFIEEKSKKKEFLSISVASAPVKPYFLKQAGMSEAGCFVRNASGIENIPLKTIKTLLSQRTEAAIGEKAATLQRLKFEQVKSYYQTAKKPLDKNFTATLDLLTSDGKYNYIAYVLSDVNSVSLRYIKYDGNEPNHILEEVEFGFCSLIKATKTLLMKFDSQNVDTSEASLPKEAKLWDTAALHQAVMFAVLYNDYASERFPKFEISGDKIEITVFGKFLQTVSKERFFDGISVHRNRGLRRIFADLGMSYPLGSETEKITAHYAKKCFVFANDYIQIVLPARLKANGESIINSLNVDGNAQSFVAITASLKKLVNAIGAEKIARRIIMKKMRLRHKQSFLMHYLQPALHFGIIEMTLPDKPNSRLQQYRLSALGTALHNSWTKKKKL
jgi:predicted HTH transcriptional regulator